MKGKRTGGTFEIRRRNKVFVLHFEAKDVPELAQMVVLNTNVDGDCTGFHERISEVADLLSRTICSE